ncbi:sulfite exporter TauE/SafE family protein [Enterococcus avium]|uniref:sulfite exporter TauE/SafE family protein n=1 Tax=Enterococcus avium TaxID=33945 RepID=UPI0032E4E0AC
MKTVLLVVLIGFIGLHVSVFGRDIFKHRKDLGDESMPISIGIGFITDFFDTLGIGAFAPTTLLVKVTRQLDDDRKLPGTLNVSHALSCLLEALIFITVVKVEPLTLFLLVASATVGSWIGSRYVTGLPEQRVQFVMGLALIVTAILMTGMINILGEGNVATGLTGVKLIIGIVGNFALGALMTMGVGLYAPCMAMVYMLGLSPLVAFPIMSASCAALMPVASINFIKTNEYARKLSLGITIGGIIGVIIAAKFVTGLDITALTWIVIVVIIFTGLTYLQKSYKTKVARNV